jgi:hypothetical protein
MIIETDRKHLLKNLKYYHSAGKKLLKKIQKKPKATQGYFELQRNVQKWFEDLNIHLDFSFSDPNYKRIDADFPVTGIAFSKAEYINTIREILVEIKLRINVVKVLPRSRKELGEAIWKILVYISIPVTIIAGTIAIMDFIKDKQIKGLNTKISEKETQIIKQESTIKILQDKYDSLKNRNKELTGILKLIKENPKTNRLLELKREKPVKLFDTKVSLYLKGLNFDNGGVQIHLRNVIFDESLDEVETIELYGSKSFTFNGKKYRIYVIDMKPDFVLIFLGNQIPGK